MLRLLEIVLSIAVLAAAVSPAAGQDRRNGATWYLRAIESLDGLGEHDAETLRAFSRSPGRTPTPELRLIVERGRHAIRLATRGSRQEYADFDLDYSQGFDLILPHLGRLRDLGRLMQAAAAIHLADGDAAGAADLLAASYRMSGHLRNDRIIISSMVGAAIFKETDEGTRLALDHASFDATHSTRLHESLDTLDARDPFDFVEAVAGEQSIAVDWLSSRFAAEGGAVLLAEELAAIAGGDEPAALIAGLDPDSFTESLDQYDAMMDRVVEAFAGDDPAAAAAALETLEQEIARGEHGVLAMALSASFSSLHERTLEIRRMLLERKAMLERLARGEADPADEANAVVFYLRAIDLLEDVPELQRLRDFDIDRERPMEDELIQLLAAAAPIIDVVVEGTRKRRCDFAFAHAEGPAMAEPYAPGLRDLCRLLHADALRKLREGDAAGALDRIETAFRLIAHLGRDEALVTSVIAHDAFRRSLQMTREAIESDAWPAAARERLIDALDQNRRKDPFGYVGSLVATRRTLERVLVDRVVAAPVDAERTARFRTQIDGLDGDRSLFVVAVLETLSTAEPRPDAVFARLDDAVSRRAYRAAAEQAHLVAPNLAQRDLGFLETVQVPSIARLAERMPDARTDLRRAYAVLRPGLQEKREE